MAAHEIPVLPGPDPKTAPFVYINEGAANIVFALPKYVPGQYVRVPTPEPTQIEEYGPGTPPPSEIASDAILYYEAPDPESESEASDEFDSKSRSRSCFSLSCISPFLSLVRLAFDR
jgi:hypothetical protein